MPINFHVNKFFSLQLKGGCAEFEILTEELELNKGFVWSLELKASITEEGTEEVQSTDKYVYINTNPYLYNLDYKRRHIKSKLPYTGKFQLTDVNIPLVDAVVQLCYSLDSNTEKTCSNFTLDSNNKITFTIPPLMNLSDSNTVQIEVFMRSLPILLCYIFLLHFRQQFPVHHYLILRCIL